MTRRTRDIVVIVFAVIVCIALAVYYGIYYSNNAGQEIEEAEAEVVTGVDEFGNNYSFEIYRENKEYALLNVYMDEDTSKTWVWGSEDISLNYSIYQDDHYVLSISPGTSDASVVCAFVDAEEHEHKGDSVEEFNSYKIDVFTKEDGTHDFKVTPAILRDEYESSIEE